MPKVVRRSVRLKAKAAPKAVTEPVEVPASPVVNPGRMVTVPTEAAVLQDSTPQTPVVETQTTQNSAVEVPTAPVPETTPPAPTSDVPPVVSVVQPTAENEPEPEAELESENDDNYYTFQISKKTFWVFVVMLIVGTLLTSGFLLWQRAENSVMVKPSPSPVVTAAVASPSPIPETSPDMSTITVQILNGSGTAGVAATVKSLFKDFGFAQIDTGNATSSGFTKTEIAAKKEVAGTVLTQISKTLEKENYTVTTDELTSSSKFDIVITVGQKGE